jgi:predicted ArsR family transcriptional regulator
VTTKNEILSLLQREPLTVLQLCERLGVTRNAINVQIKQLEAEGLVRRSRLRQHGALGKPAVRYEAAPGSEDVGSGAYRALLLSLLKVLAERQEPLSLADTLDQAGRQLARDAGLAKPTNFESGLWAAMAAADALGASTEAAVQPGGVMVRNYSCPLGSAVRGEACVCRALAAFFSEATGRPVAEQCLRDGRLICQYFIEQAAAP